jgi:hypothetical protein
MSKLRFIGHKHSGERVILGEYKGDHRKEDFRTFSVETVNEGASEI